MRIKDWNKFQHFKDRKPPWIKLYRDLLDDITWHELDAKAAKALVMIWLIASEYDGNLPDIKTLAFRLRVSESEAKSIVSKLSHWVIQDDIKPISSRYQDDTLEVETETETERETEREGAKERTRASRLSIDWKPDASLNQDSFELAKFRDYWIAKAGKDAVKLDWDATWRNWLRKAGKPIAKQESFSHRPVMTQKRPVEPVDEVVSDEDRAKRKKQVDELLKGIF